jgi:hypothetical protein
MKIILHIDSVVRVILTTVALIVFYYLGVRRGKKDAQFDNFLNDEEKP